MHNSTKQRLIQSQNKINEVLFTSLMWGGNWKASMAWHTPSEVRVAALSIEVKVTEVTDIDRAATSKLMHTHCYANECPRLLQ